MKYDENEGLSKSIELKAKVGDCIYLPWEYDGISDIATLHITSIVIDGFGICYITDFGKDTDIAYSDKYHNGLYRNEDFDVIVFTDRKKAANATKKKK